MTIKINFLYNFNGLGSLETKGTNFSEKLAFAHFLKNEQIVFFQSDKTAQKHILIVIFDVKFAADHAPGVSFSISVKEN